MRTFADKLKSLVWGSAEDRLGLARQKLREKKLTGGGIDAEYAGIEPDSIVWVFGASRSGSTWLASMVRELPGWDVWFEPRVGTVFDPETRPNKPGWHYVFALEHERAWLPAVRLLVLAGAASRCPSADFVLIKDPASSGAASVLTKALPESRVVFLVRDPRDVAASWLDANADGGWRRARKGGATETPLEMVARYARVYSRQVGGAKRAYEAHSGPKALVRYEELRADTMDTMKRIYEALYIPTDENELSRAVEKHSWENIPQGMKGKGKFCRKATPGSWREDLSQEQARVVEEITRPILEEFYPRA
jgi:hypothetical protein